MAAKIEDPNPGISILDDPQVKRQIAVQARHALEMADVLKNAPRPSDEQVEREVFQYESNEYASKTPLYAAARAAANAFLVVPLEPNGTKPLVDLKEATRDDRQLYEWWLTWPDANPGVLLGRVGGIFALRVEDLAAHIRLREMAAVHHPEHEDGRDSSKAYTEYRDIGGYTVALVGPSRPFSIRSRSGWGRDFSKAVAETIREDRKRQPQTFWLVFSYHHVQSGMDAWDFRSRKVLPGVTLLGEGEVMAWDGSILEGGIRVVAPMSRPPDVPVWLAQMVGRARSRKVMAAAREQYEADLRLADAHVMATLAMQRHFEDQERAIKDREQAERILAEEMAKGE
jgi:Bifunctional DNA primase/polymerase, N-terminal